MKDLKRQSLMLGAGVLVAGSLITFAQPVDAKPKHKDKDKKHESRDRGRHRGHDNNRGRHRGHDKDRDRRDDDRDDDRNDRWDRDRNQRDRWEHDRNRDQRDRHNRNRDDNRWDNSNNNGFTGVVTRVKSGNEFDVNIGGRSYNVYTTSRLPRGFNVRDVVRISGVRVGNNDIRNARVVVVNNR